MKISLNPTYLKALWLYQQKKWQAAANELQKVRQQDPNNAKALFKLGMCHYRLKQWIRAADRMTEALALAPENEHWTVQLKVASKNASLAKQADKTRLTKQPVKPVPKQKPVGFKPRLTLQLLQAALLENRHQFFAEIRANLYSMTPTPMAQELAIFDVEAALELGDLESAHKLMDRLSDSDKAYYRARECLIVEDDPMGVLGILAPGCDESGDPWPVAPLPIGRLIFLALARAGRHSAAMVQLEALIALYGLTLDFCHDLFDFIPASVGADMGMRLSRQLALKAADAGPSKNATEISKGWGGRRGRPLWLLPFEALAIKHHYARPQVLNRLLNVVRQQKWLCFLVGETLASALQEGMEQEFADCISLGLVVQPGEDPATLIGCLARQAAFLPCQPLPTSSAYRLLSLDGVSISIHVYRMSDMPGHVHHPADNGDLTQPFSGTEWRTIGGYELPLPVPCGVYQKVNESANLPGPAGADLSSSTLPVLYRTFANACEEGDPALVKHLADQIKSLGDWAPFMHLAKMQSAYISSDLPRLLSEPRLLLHFGDGVESDFHIDLWYPFVKTVDPSAILAIRSQALFKHLQSTRPDLPAFYIKSGIESEWLVSNASSLAAVLYVSNTGNVVHFLRFNHLRHVFLGHGDSEKTASCHKFFRAYDEVWTAGRAHIDRFRHSGMDHSSVQFRVVGRPTLRKMIEASRGKAEPSFLYLPTWEGFQAEQDYTSIRNAEEFLPVLTQVTGSHAMVKFHPWVGKRLAGLTEVESKLSAIHADSNISVIERSRLAADLMPRVSFLIADISSVISDYLPTGRPIFLYLPSGRDIRTSSSGLPMENYCYVFRTPQELASLVERVIVGQDDWLHDQRKKAAHFFVDGNRTIGLSFERELYELARRQGKPFANSVGPVSRDIDRPRTLIVGHRGAKAKYVENSMAGFKAVANMPGLDAVEFDVHMTADGELVVIHDPTLDRTTNGTGVVADVELVDLRQFKLRDLIKEKGAVLEEPVPTLQEVLDCLTPTGLGLHIELKSDLLGNSYPGMVEKILDLIDTVKLRDRVTLTSFSPEVLWEIRTMDADIPLLASINARSVEMMGGLSRCLALFQQIPGCLLAIEQKILRRLMVTNDGSFKLDRVGIWVVNDPNEARAAMDSGLCQITTDDPELILKNL